MKLPSFYEFEPLNNIKEKMGIPRTVYGDLTVEFSGSRLTELELEKLTSASGLDISADELVILNDGTLAYKNTRVILYIRDITVYGSQEIQPRFHLANCTTLQKMKDYKRFDRYVVSINTNGRFDLNIIKSQIKTKRENCELSVCQNCLSLLNFDGFLIGWPKTKREIFVKQFTIEHFFEKYPRSLHVTNPTYNSGNAPLNNYTEDFNAISIKIREHHKWICQQCWIDLSDIKQRHWLHVHHINGLKYDNNPENLQCICVKCHADKPNHNHMKQLPEYSNFMAHYYGKKP